jgi:hypothetical protein
LERDLINREWWTHEFHPMGAPELRVLGWHRVRLGDRIEERFHLAGGRESNQEPAWRSADKRPSVSLGATL